MSTVGARPSRPFAHRKPKSKPLLRIVVARGERFRAFTLRPWLVGTALGGILLLGAVYLMATAYMFFHDDLLAAAIARQGQIKAAYEDRISALRADIDRLNSRQLGERQALAADLDRLVGRQAVLDQRQDILAGLAQAARRAGIVPGDLAPTAAPEAPPADEHEAPAQDDVLTTGSIEPAGVRAPIAAAMLRSGSSADPLPVAPETKELSAVASSLDALAGRQVALVEDMADVVEGRSVKIASILKSLGRTVPVGASDDEAGEGGPFIPLDDNADPETFRTTVALVSGEMERLASMRATAAKLPLAKPLPEATITSRFGARLDPFLHRPALHPGIDFLAVTGYPVRATAVGTVTTAEEVGGYGNMIEIDHGGGVSTRYGHLSDDPGDAGPEDREGSDRRTDRQYRPLDRSAPPLRGPPRRHAGRPDALHPRRRRNRSAALRARSQVRPGPPVTPQARDALPPRGRPSRPRPGRLRAH